MASFRAVCRFDELVDQCGRLFVVDDQPLCLIRSGDSVFAIDDRCPHAGASLSRGYLEGDVLRCRIHHWGFRVSDGVCVDQNQPSCNARCFSTRVVNGIVEVALED
jgi:nitrite reductase/ring-hydroxylating ferredoxin subunit